MKYIIILCMFLGLLLVNTTLAASDNGTFDETNITEATNSNGTSATLTESIALASPPKISFIYPTPANGAIINKNYAFINTTVSGAATSFIDWNRSLIGWWKFNNETGENSAFFKDWSSWGNNGACSGINCPVLTSGKFGKAPGFDGSNDYVDVPNSASLNPSKITLEAWFYANSGGLANQKPLIQKPFTSHVAPYYQYMLSLADTAGNPRSAEFYLTINGVLQNVEINNLGYNYSKWHYLAGTYDGLTMTMYLDGVAVGTTPIVGTITPYNTILEFGAYPNRPKDSSHVFNGKLDEIRIHRRALSPGEIKASYNAGIYRLYNNFTNQPAGVYNYRAYAQALSGNVNKTEMRSLTLTSPPISGPPSITGYAPVSPVNDIPEARRAFNITVNQTVNVNWYINGNPVQVNGSVTNAKYTNTSASAGTWIVNATASNANGRVSREWTWTVKAINRKLNIPTYDGSNQAVHPDIYYNANKWNGYRYWMAMTPYPNGDAAYENPSIVVSNDNLNWTVPPGLTNPVVPAPSNGNNADPDLVYNPALNRLELYYIEEHGWTGTAYLKRKISTDGIHWTPPETLFGLYGNGIQVPGIEYVNGVAHMWYIEYLNPFPSTTYVWYRNSTDNGATWSAAQNVTLSTTSWGAHHLDIEYVPGINEFWMALLAFEKSNTTNKKVFLAKSKNKLYWNVNTSFELTKSDKPWKSSGIYRSSLLYNKGRSTIQVWDSGKSGTVWSIGYTEKSIQS